MMRVGIPAAYPADLFCNCPAGVEFVPVSEQTEGVVEVDVWIPDPYVTRAIRTLAHLSGVKLVMCMTAGSEWLSGAVGPEVTVCNARGAHNIATAEWTLSAMLASLKHFSLYQDIQRSGVWKRRMEAGVEYARQTGDARRLHPPVLLEELTGKRVLLVGYGEIGKEIERMLAPFRVQLTRVALRERKAQAVHAVKELDSLLPEAEIVILILPISETSRGLFGAGQFALMRQGALLVNAARGAIVDTDALVEALQAGKIRAALDVTDPEPLPEGHPLWSCPNLLLTPHVASLTPEYMRRAVRVIAEELTRYANGEPLRNVVQGGH